MKVLIIGGAGYIGAQMYYYLRDQACEALVLDDLSTGHEFLIPNADLIVGDFADLRLLKHVLSQHRFDAVMHFAALSIVADSMLDPLRYYHNNVAKTLLLLTTLLEHDIKHIIFSSTAAVYGQPLYLPIDSKHRTLPINPYGMSKLAVEQLLNHFSVYNGLKYVALRYFNAAGADPQERCGECHDPETHLIPRLLRELPHPSPPPLAGKGRAHPIPPPLTGEGRVGAIQIYGDQYPTRDGTCERDYIHVYDLAAAHYCALMQLRAGHDSAIYNLGTGQGYTVKEVIAAVQRVTGHSLTYSILPPRPGDPASLVAEPDSAFPWRCQRGSIDSIILDAWRWEQKKNALIKNSSPEEVLLNF